MSAFKRWTLFFLAIILGAGMLFPASLSFAKTTADAPVKPSTGAPAETSTDLPAKTPSIDQNASQADHSGRASEINLIKGTYEPGEVIIMFNDDKAKESLGDDFSVRDSLTFSDDLKTALVTSDKYSTKQMIGILSKNDKIDVVEPNHYLTPARSDSYSSYRLNDEYAAYLYQNNAPAAKNTAGKSVDNRGYTRTPVSVNAASGWKKLTGKEKESVVAVLDTGVNTSHEDLKNVLWTNPGNIGLKGKHGYNFLGGNTDISDQDGHGTHCCGLIAAQANNNKGIAGSAGGANVKIMMLKTIDETGESAPEELGDTYIVLRAFNYVLKAKQRGVNIVATSNSWGQDATQSTIFDKVIDKLGKAGILTFIAAGNTAKNMDHAVETPVSTESKYAIIVGAAGITAEPAGFSNYGKMHVDLFAPGVNTLSTVAYPSYFPNIYSKSELDRTTEYYGTFTAGTKISGGRVIPDKGEGGEDVKQFGESVFLRQTDDIDAGKAAPGSKAGCEMKIVKDHFFTSGKNHAALKVTIKNARLGDEYYLYFPFSKNPATTGDENTSFSLCCESGKVDADAMAEIRGGEVIKTNDGTIQLAGQGKKGSYIDLENKYSASHLISGGAPEGSTILPADSKDGKSLGLGFLIQPSADSYTRDVWKKSTHDLTFYIDSIGLSKPGVKVDPNSSYDVMSGTSMACPVAAGASALTSALYPKKKGESGAAYSTRIKNKLYSCVRHTNALKNKCATGGYLDLRLLGAKDPVISDAVCDLKKKTLTLKGANLSRKQTLTYRRIYSSKSKNIKLPTKKMKLKYSKNGKKVVITNAKKLFGTMTEFKAKNKDGSYGKRTFFLVKGQKKLKKVTARLFSRTGKNGEQLSDTAFNLLTNKKGSKLYAFETLESKIYKLKKKKLTEVKGTSLISAFRKMLRKKGVSKRNLKKHDITVTKMEKQLNYGNMFYIPVTDDYGNGKQRHYLARMDLSKKKLKWKFGKYKEMPLKKNFIAESFHCEIIGKKIYQIAESNDPEQKSIFRIYDMKKKKWKKGPKIPGKIKSPLLQRYKGKLYLMFGKKVKPRKGYNVQSMVSGAVYRLDGRKWKRAGSLKYVGKYSPSQGTPDYIKFCAPVKNGLVFMDTSVDGLGNVFLYDPVKNKKKPLYYTIGNSNSDPHSAGTASCAATKGGIYYTRDCSSEIKTGYSLWKLPAKAL